jgi:hypothetical protein
MSLLDIAALMRRHAVAVLIVLVLVAAFGYELKHDKPLYNDSSTVVFRTSVDPFGVGNGLLVTADLMARSMMSPHSEQLVRQAGGTVDYQVNLVNLYNIEYPDYSDPYVTVSVTASDPVDAERTFSAVMQVLSSQLKSQQAMDGVSSANQIYMNVLSATTGAIPLTGYPKRTFGALAVLTIIAVFLVTAFLDRRPIRLRNFRYFSRSRLPTSRSAEKAAPALSKPPSA